MNRLRATSLILFAAICAHAQITLTQSDMPQIGSVFVTVSDTAPTVSPGQAGPNQTWDLSAIKNVTAETTFCVTPSSTPYFADYPTANLAVRFRTTLDTTFEYSNSSSTSLVSLGDIVIEPAGIYSATISPGITTLPLPATYLTHWSNSPTDVATTISGAVTVKQISHLSISDTVDGWGTVITPAGSFSALRVKQIQTTLSDSLFSYSAISGTWTLITATAGGITGESFLWGAASKGQWVASLDFDSLGGRTRAARYLGSPIAGISQPTRTSAAQINRSSRTNYVPLSTPQGSEITILNMQGRLIKRLAASGDETIINISSFPSGLYFFKVNGQTSMVIKK